MANEQNLTPFQKGQIANPNGRPKGSKNRSTIAKMVLNMVYKPTDKVWMELKAKFPELEEGMTVEQVMTVVQAHKAIAKMDGHAYNAILNSAYGMPKQELDVTSDDQPLTEITVKVIHSGPPLAGSEKEISDKE